MTRHLSKILIFALPVACLHAQPVINSSGITNAASYESAILGLAQGSYFVVYGRNFGASAGPVSSLPMPTSLGTTSVSIRSVVNSQTYQAFMYYVTPTQLSGILPSAVPVGAADMIITAGGTSTAPQRFNVARSKFGIFTVNSIPNGQAIIQNYDAGPPASVPVNLYLRPARPGQTLILWGTGLGPYTAGPDNQAPAAGNIADNVDVMIGDFVIKPFYAGRAPGIPGVDQINFTLPNDASLPDGCTIPISIRIGTVFSNQTTFAKATTGDVCVHPMGLSTDLLRRMDAGETFKAGFIQLERRRSDLGNGLISGTEDARLRFAQFNTGSSPHVDVRDPTLLNIPSGTCIVSKNAGRPPVVIDRFPFPIARTGHLDAGSSILLEGLGKSKAIPGDGNGGYQEQLAEMLELPFPIPGLPASEKFLGDGTFTLRGTGGRAVGAFTATAPINGMLAIPEPARTGNRGQPFSVRWTGGGNEPGDFVLVYGLASDLTGASPSVFFECRVPATARSFNIPGDVTGQFAANSAATILVTGTPASGRFTFTAPMVTGGTLDSGIGQVTSTELFQVLFQ